MINYILITLHKEKLSTAELHLLEHCYTEEIISILDKFFLNCGIIVNSETFLDSFTLQLFYSNIELTDKILFHINSIIFTEKQLIDKQISVIQDEVTLNDLSEEDIVLYTPLKNFNEDITNLYQSNFKNDSYIDVFNQQIKKINVLTYVGGISQLISREPMKNQFIPSKSMDMKDNYITGFISIKTDNVHDLIAGLFTSFILGKNTESLIFKKYLEPFNLYLGYSIDLSFYNMFLILYLIDTNQTSRTTLVKNNSKNYLSSIEDFAKYLEPFKTFFIYNDPFLIEFNKLLLNSNIKNTYTLQEILRFIDMISFSKIKEHLKGVS